MVKPQKNQATEENREYMIPKTFEKYCGKDFELRKIRAQDYPQLTVAYLVGPRRPTFAIYNNSGEIVAEFHPNGVYSCKTASFRPTFEKMVEDIEKSAQRIARKYKEYEVGI